MNITAAATLALVPSAVPATAQTPLQPGCSGARARADWHGKRPNDSCFWLREKDNPAVLDCPRAENSCNEAMTQGLVPMTNRLYKKRLGRIKDTALDVPVRRGNGYGYRRTVRGPQ